ncbi:hypothetical protein HQQ81_01485 [Microbacteriaceae bacterium VKM Ac-2854]|nr:hypothetical protein [Microbacteriaceae bacterium VKM Ac-2854]
MSSTPPADHSRGVSRRSTVAAVAWTVPTVAVASGAPAAAASGAKSGTITFAPIPVTTIPGAPFPTVTVRAETKTGTIDATLSLTLTLPDSVVFIDPEDHTISTEATIVIPPSKKAAASLELTNIFAAPDAKVGPDGPATVSALPTGWELLAPPQFDVIPVPTPALGTGAVWGQNVETETFSVVAAPLLWAAPLNGLPQTQGPVIVDYNTSQDGFVLVAKPGGGTALYSGNRGAIPPGIRVGNPGYDFALQPLGLDGPEFLIQLSLANYALSNLGRVVFLITGRFFTKPFVHPLFAPHGVCIKQIATQLGSGYVYALDSAGRAWSFQAVDPLESPNELNVPQLITGPGGILGGIVEVGDGGLLLAADGTVFQVPDPRNRVAVPVGGDGAKLAGNATPNVWAYITKDGAVKSWGDGANNRHSSSSTEPVPIPSINQNVESIRLGRRVLDFYLGEQGATSVIYEDHSVFAWGDNGAGQLGNAGAPAPSAGPVRVVAGGAAPGGFLSATHFYHSRRAFGVATP